MRRRTRGGRNALTGRATLVTLLLLAVAGTVGVVRKVMAPGVVIDGRRWVVALECDFGQGWCPAGWGWGDWALEDGRLTGRGAVDPAVYLYGVPESSRPAAWDAGAHGHEPLEGIGNSGEPVSAFRHDGSFAMEAGIRLLPDPAGHPTEAQLLVRGGPPGARHVAGATLHRGRDYLTVRYQVGGLVLVRRARLPGALGDDGWHTLRFVLAPDRALTVWVDQRKRFDSRTARPRTAPGRAPGGGVADSTAGLRLPPGQFTEPHLIVRGAASFRYVRLYTLRTGRVGRSDSGGIHRAGPGGAP